MAIRVATVKVKVTSTKPDEIIDYDAEMTSAIEAAREAGEKVAYVQKRDASSGIQSYSIWFEIED